MKKKKEKMLQGTEGNGRTKTNLGRKTNENN